MEYLVLSDSHGKAARLISVLEQLTFRPAAILFLGDGLRDLQLIEEDARFRDIPIYAVRGNCDSFTVGCEGVPEEHVLCVGEHRILMLHGHRCGTHFGEGGLIACAHANRADIVLYGHTHLARETTVPVGTPLSDGSCLTAPLLLANPGSIGQPRDGSVGRFGVLTIQAGGVLFSHGSCLT